MPQPGEAIVVAMLPNLRDLGGWRTADGRQVRYGLLFRSTDLAKLGESDQQFLSGLGLRTIYDLRSIAERTTEPDVTLAGATEIALDVLADAPHAVPGNLTGLLSDPSQLAAAKQQLGDVRLEDLMRSSYGHLVQLPSARASYRSFFRGLLGDQPTPALFHCTTGKDRTGWAAASFLSLMGVSADDVFREYLLTNEQLVPALEQVFVAFEHAGGNRSVLLPVLGVERGYLEQAFATVVELYGDIEGYFTNGLGIGPDDQEALRQRYLEAG